VTSYLPALLSILPDLHTALHEIGAYHQACARLEWNGADTSKKQRTAFENVKRRVLAAANRLDLLPEERANLVKQLKHARTENAGLKDTVARLQEENRRLTEANVIAMQGRAA
jgi:hypothetical protein